MGPLIDLWRLTYTDSVVATGALLLGVAAGVLGTFAVLRGRSLVGDALAHAALPGVCVAFLVTGAKDPATLVAGAACAGIVGAFTMVGIERSTRIKPDTAIGVVLSVFFSLGIVLLTAIAAGDNANQAGLERYLFGQAAGLVEADVKLMAFLAAGSLGLVVAGFRPLKTTLFDPAYAGATGLPVRALELAMTGFLVVAVVIGLRTVGAILMVAMLVTPAVAARQFVARLALLLPLAGGRVRRGDGGAAVLARRGAHGPGHRARRLHRRAVEHSAGAGSRCRLARRPAAARAPSRRRRAAGPRDRLARRAAADAGGARAGQRPPRAGAAPRCPRAARPGLGQGRGRPSRAHRARRGCRARPRRPARRVVGVARARLAAASARRARARPRDVRGVLGS